MRLKTMMGMILWGFYQCLGIGICGLGLWVGIRAVCYYVVEF